MTRNDWLKEFHEAAYAVGIDYKEAHLLTVIQEYDRLTAVNAQLLEACKVAQHNIDTVQTTYLWQANEDLRAAIRAAEGASDATQD